jgi:hypothetical protein
MGEGTGHFEAPDGLEHVQWVDTDGDGVPDAEVLDITGDGHPDLLFDHFDAAGQPHVLLVDSNADGMLDRALVDTTGDGHPDLQYDQFDASGTPHEVLIDTNADGVADHQIVDQGYEAAAVAGGVVPAAPWITEPATGTSPGGDLGTSGPFPALHDGFDAQFDALVRSTPSITLDPSVGSNNGGGESPTTTGNAADAHDAAMNAFIAGGQIDNSVSRDILDRNWTNDAVQEGTTEGVEAQNSIDGASDAIG